MAIISGLIEATLFNKFVEGGALFMPLVLVCLLMSIYFTVKSIMNFISTGITNFNLLPNGVISVSRNR